MTEWQDCALLPLNYSMMLTRLRHSMEMKDRSLARFRLAYAADAGMNEWEATCSNPSTKVTRLHC
ncbi:unnamed protein product [Ectocarpus sp. CCAP 1310/34]|nr:unnamed protein product [Ectocarpus sp. CCAP 1310/34]